MYVYMSSLILVTLYITDVIIVLSFFVTRIDNFSDVQLTYFQTKCTEDLLRGTVRARSAVAYAWDEPTLPPHITLSVHGGSSATYNMDIISDGDQLFYENFIYIAFKATFK